MSREESSVTATMVKFEDISYSDETEVNFKSNLTDIKLEPEEEEVLLNIKQEEVDIKDEFPPSTSTFNGEGDRDFDGSEPSINNRKQEEIEEVILLRAISPFQNNSNHDDNAPSVSFEKPNQKFVSSHKKQRVIFFVCNICQFKCAHEGHLKIHLRRHTEAKPFSCDLCDFKSVKKYSLKVHMRTHTGEKPFGCGICDFRSAQKGDVTVHKRTHTGQRPFACNLCDFRSARKGGLTNHIRTHTGEKPFSCELCAFKTAQKSTLVRHMKIHYEFFTRI